MVKIVKESLEDELINLQKSRLESPFGYIDYGYSKKSKKYLNGILVFMGSYIYKEFRGQGKFKEMVKLVLSEFTEGTIVQVPVENKKLVPMFERMNFKRVKKIEYWGELKNSILMQGIITKDTINLI